MAESGESQRPSEPDTAEGPQADTETQVEAQVETLARLEPAAGAPEGAAPRLPAPSAIVGIGGSAGALDGYERFFTGMPTGGGLAFVVVPHLDPAASGVIPELLARCTLMPVLEITDGQQVQPDHVYVLPPGHTLGVMGGRLLLTPEPRPHRPIDGFFESLADDQAERAVGVILSGMGTDGSAGVRAIKASLGRVFVQDPASAQYASMPQSAVATGAADQVRPAEDLAAELYAQVTRTPALHPEDAAVGGGQASAALQKILLQVRARTGQDFSAYKHSTLVRRIDRRMKSAQISDLAHYARLLQESPAEVDALFRDFLINVTSFFRDPQAFEALGTELRAYLREHESLGVFRAWITGCSTGEEAYSLAMLLSEVLDEFRDTRHVRVQIFATDLDQNAIDVARLGQYPPQIAYSVSPQRLERFFRVREGGFQVSSELREMIVFARHNTFGDPPFTRLDLLSCRNLLIYFGPELQKQVMPLFHYALKPGGLLFLGPSETVGAARDLFAALSNRWKLYRSGGGGRVSAAPPLELGGLPPSPPPLAQAAAPRSPAQPSQRSSSLSQAVQRMILHEWSPPAVAVDPQGNVVSVSGRTGAYLELPVGAPSTNLLDMAPPALRFELSAALREAAGGREVERPGLTVSVNGELRRLDLIVRPFHPHGDAQALVVVVFMDRGPLMVAGDASAPAPPDRSATLERELTYARAHLQTTIEEMEVSLEERRSSNEELQTTNEELQSSNEELMTSKEELQSLNEELITINAEHQLIITDLQQANDDMKNLMDSIGIATLFVGNDLRIKRFTPRITQVINLMPVDVGRPLTDLASNLRYGNLPEDILRVLDTLTPFETSVQTHTDDWFLMRVSPYRTFDNFIDGVVVVFTNIGPLKRLEQQQRRALLYSEAILDTLSDPVIVLDQSLRVVSHNKALLTLLGLADQNLEGERLYDLGNGQFDQSEFVGHLRELSLGGAELSDFLLEMDLPGRGREAVKLNARQLVSADETTELLLLWGEDVTPILRQVAQRGADAVHDPAPDA